MLIQKSITKPTTTFCGLAPMIFETSRQAQFVVPMAVSLAFDILFTTLVCLLVLPSLYLVINNKVQPTQTDTSTLPVCKYV